MPKEGDDGAEELARTMFAARLGALMAERGLDPLGVWEQTRISPSSIHRYLAGQSSPRVAQLRRLVECFERLGRLPHRRDRRAARAAPGLGVDTAQRVLYGGNTPNEEGATRCPPPPP